MDTVRRGAMSITEGTSAAVVTIPSQGPLHLSGRIDPFRVVEQDAFVTSRAAEALEQVYREHAARLWRALVAYAGNREVADDALAEAFAQAAGRGLRAPERWVWVAAFRIAAGLLKVREPSGAAPVASASIGPSETLELLDALMHLSPRQRAVLVLHYYGDYKAREIAQIVGSTPATVRVHLSAGRRRLRELLEVDDD
jgi:DNA-directed RNA polymerase specialized sigma24 family protein